MTLVAVVCFGLIIGSFLNVCIHRLPIGESRVAGVALSALQSAASPHDNIPVIGYLC
jgi:leader peptidase (prepilin peptidase)/N-methyltransferase